MPSLAGVMASSFGRILLPPSTAPLPNGGQRSYLPKPSYGFLTRSSVTAKHEYMNYKSRKYGNIKIHRAVCEAFHGPCPFDGAVVIHIDEDATNNRPENLKWGTQKENLNMDRIKEYHRSRTGDDNPLRKGIKRRLAA